MRRLLLLLLLLPRWLCLVRCKSINVLQDQISHHCAKEQTCHESSLGLLWRVITLTHWQNNDTVYILGSCNRLAGWRCTTVAVPFASPLHSGDSNQLHCIYWGQESSCMSSYLIWFRTAQYTLISSKAIINARHLNCPTESIDRLSHTKIANLLQCFLETTDIVVYHRLTQSSQVQVNSYSKQPGNAERNWSSQIPTLNPKVRLVCALIKTADITRSIYLFLKGFFPHHTN